MKVQRIIKKSLESKIFVVFTLIAIIITSSTFLMSPVEPHGPSLGRIVVNDEIFDLSEYPSLERRVLGLWNSLRELYDVNDLSNASINDLSILPPVLTQYFLAFTIYGMAQIVDSTPSYRSAYHTELFDKIILMMNSSEMEQFEWIDPGYSEEYYEDFGNDFRGPTNIMWTGHYALMELLYYNTFRDPRYNSEIQWYLDDWNNSLTMTTTWDNRSSVDDQGRPLGMWGCGLIPCEPYIVFVQCNSIPFYAMRLYDELFGTNYQAASLPGIDWWQENMIDPNGIQIDGYFNMEPDVSEGEWRNDLPSTYPNPALTVGKTDWPKVASYGSTWANMFYYAMGETELAIAQHKNWKTQFIHYTTENMAYSPHNYHYPSSFSTFDLLGNLFGYFATKELNDEDLFRKIENWFYAPFPGSWIGDKYRFDTSALGDLGSFFDPILNFGYAWGHSDSSLANLMDPKPDSYFLSAPYISSTDTTDGLFIYQAFYDTDKEAFILTLETNEVTALTFENFPDIQGIFAKSGEFDTSSWVQNGDQMVLTLQPGTYSFVII